MIFTIFHCVSLKQILLVHEASKGSFSRVFDFESNDVNEDESQARTSPFESRFPINIGVTGHVATTGEVSNSGDNNKSDKNPLSPEMVRMI